MLGHRAKDVDRQLIGVRHVYRNEVHPGFHQVRDEGHVPGKSIELGNYQRGLVLLRRFHRLGQLGAIGPLAALNLSELGYQLPRAAIQKSLDGSSLGLQT